MSVSVSVVIPTHNRADLVERGVRSVLEQSPAPAEVIVVDDASTDATPAALAGFGDAITVIRTEQNVERGAARNLGARRSSGDAIAFLDSDDEWMAGKLEAQRPALEAGRASVTGLRYIDGDGADTGARYTPPAGAGERITVRNQYLGAPSSLAISRAAFEAVGGFPERRDVQGAEDWVFLMKLILAGNRVEVIDRPLVRYRLHAGNDTGDPARREQAFTGAMAYIEREGILAGAELRRMKAYTAGTIGRGFAHVGDLRSAWRWAREAARSGAPATAARAELLIAASAVKGWVKRQR